MTLNDLITTLEGLRAQHGGNLEVFETGTDCGTVCHYPVKAVAAKPLYAPPYTGQHTNTPDGTLVVVVGEGAESWPTDKLSQEWDKAVSALMKEPLE